jgi:hypothetical protein
MSVQAKGEPAASVPATIQTPKAMIPTEIKSESTVSMIGPLLLAWHAIEHRSWGPARIASDRILLRIAEARRR